MLAAKTEPWAKCSGFQGGGLSISKSLNPQITARSRAMRHADRGSNHPIPKQHRHSSTGVAPGETFIVRLVEVPGDSGILTHRSWFVANKARLFLALHSNYSTWRPTDLGPAFETLKDTAVVTASALVRLLTIGVETRS